MAAHHICQSPGCRLLLFWLLTTWIFIFLKLTQNVHNTPKNTVPTPESPILVNLPVRTEENVKADTSCDDVIRTRLSKPLGNDKTPHLTCGNLFAGDIKAVHEGVKYMSAHPHHPTSDEDMLNVIGDCKVFKRQRNYIYNISQEEANFPIAYSIVAHKFGHQMEQLLHAIYRPHNAYCIHVDKKSSYHFQQAMVKLASCFANVFLSSEQEQVVYASFSRLQADMNCMKDLLKSKVKWKYLINLAGTSFPLKTNLEIVRILQIYNGSNDIEGMSGNRVFWDRVSYKWKVNGRSRLVKTDNIKSSPPGSLEIMKGSAFGAFTREFLGYIISLPLAREFLEWSHDTYSPDEHYWATLNHIGVNSHLQSPGGYKGDPNSKPWLMAYSKWQKVNPCQGKYIHWICVFGIGDLADIINQHHLFANKFHQDFQYLSLDCMEEWIQARSVCPLPFNTSYYAQLPLADPKLRYTNQQDLG